MIKDEELIAPCSEEDGSGDGNNESTGNEGSGNTGNTGNGGNKDEGNKDEGGRPLPVPPPAGSTTGNGK